MAEVVEASSSSSSPSSSSSLPWVEKYRPVHLDDLVSHKEIVGTITRFIDENRLPHLLFYGPPGTGKTSTILACARRLYGPKYQTMTLEIEEFASTRTIFSSGFKLIVLDEADAMTNPAQAALRRIIEKYTKNVRFCLICNYVGKIIPALQSRCTRFRFAPLSPEQMNVRLQHVISEEHISIDDEGREALLKLAAGDMRKTLNILQSTVAAFGTVTGDAVYLTVGHPLPKDLKRAAGWLLSESVSVAYDRIYALMTNKGVALPDILRDIHNLLFFIDLTPEARVYLLDQLSNIEHNLSSGCSDKLQLGALVGSFYIARSIQG